VPLPRRQRVDNHESYRPTPTRRRKTRFSSTFVVPAGPPPAAHGSPGLLLTFPATRPSRTIPSLKSDIGRTGGCGDGERERETQGPTDAVVGFKTRRGSPSAPLRCQFGLTGWVFALTPSLSGGSPTSVTHRCWRRKAELAAGGGAKAGPAAHQSVQSNATLIFF